MEHYSANEEYPCLENNNSHMAHCLTEEIYKRMRSVETTSGFSIDEVIQIGVDNPGDPYSMSVGCLAGDEECYSVFSEFFDQVIEARHDGYKPENKQPVDTDPSLLVVPNLVVPNPITDKYVISCQLKGIRNVKGFCLTSHCTRGERRKVEAIAKEVFSKFPVELAGKYHRLSDATKEQQKSMFANLSLHSPLSAQFPSCMYRDWPDARGVWINDKNNLSVVVNLEDHLCIVSSSKNWNLKETYDTWRKSMDLIEKLTTEAGWEFMKNDHLGYISTCPGNLGTGIKIKTQMKLPKMSKSPRFEEALRRLRLERCAENIESSNGICEILNADCLGLTEVELVQSVIDGIQFLANCENKLENRQSIERDINLIKRK